MNFLVSWYYIRVKANCYSGTLVYKYKNLISQVVSGDFIWFSFFEWLNLFPIFFFVLFLFFDFLWLLTIEVESKDSGLQLKCLLCC